MPQCALMPRIGISGRMRSFSENLSDTCVDRGWFLEVFGIENGLAVPTGFGDTIIVKSGSTIVVSHDGRLMLDAGVYQR